MVAAANCKLRAMRRAGARAPRAPARAGAASSCRTPRRRQGSNPFALPKRGEDTASDPQASGAEAQNGAAPLGGAEGGAAGGAGSQDGARAWAERSGNLSDFIVSEEARAASEAKSVASLGPLVLRRMPHRWFVVAAMVAAFVLCNMDKARRHAPKLEVCALRRRFRTAVDSASPRRT